MQHEMGTLKAAQSFNINEAKFQEKPKNHGVQFSYQETYQASIESSIADRAWLRLSCKANTTTTMGNVIFLRSDFNKENIAYFFNVLEKQYDKRFYPTSNVDETGLTVVQNIVDRNGKR